MKPITATSAVEFLIWLLIAASAIAMLAKRLRAPYTVALVAGGLMLSALRLPRLSPLDPGQRPDWLTPDVILIVFLPALVFEGSVKCKRLTNTPVRQSGSVLKCPDDRKNRVVGAQTTYPRGSSALGGRVCEQRYAAERVLPESRFELQHAGSPSEEATLEERA